MNNKDFLIQFVFSLLNIENVNILECQKILEENEIVCIKQAFKQELIFDIKSILSKNLIQPMTRFIYPKDFKLIMDNFQKIVNVDGERAVSFVYFSILFFQRIFTI